MNDEGTRSVYPLQLTGTLDPTVSRWQWLVKWLLLIPHVIVLVFLWIASLATTVVAGFSILFTERYPRAIFDFNVGVMRWTWRVGFYSYSALGTDRYPPFTLADVADYPARLAVDYPRALSRGLVLVKWWLLAIPHYLVVGVFAGGGLGVVNASTDHGVDLRRRPDRPDGAHRRRPAALHGRYPRDLRLRLGMNRWVFRVMAYAALMTDATRRSGSTWAAPSPTQTRSPTASSPPRRRLGSPERPKARPTSTTAQGTPEDHGVPRVVRASVSPRRVRRRDRARGARR